MTSADNDNIPQEIFDSERMAKEALDEKMWDVQTVPGYIAELDPLEAEILGAFEEEALSFEDALASAVDLPGQE